MSQYFTKDSLDYAEMMVGNCLLAFQRAEERDDFHAMSIACGKGAYWEREAMERGGESVTQSDRNDFTAAGKLFKR